MTKEEQQFNQWFDKYANGVKVFEEADMKQAYLQGRAELEKENAELKRIVEMVAMINKGVYSDEGIKAIYAEAEQFLQNCDIDNAIQQANKGLDFDKIADEMEQDLKDSEVEK